LLYYLKKITLIVTIIVMFIEVFVLLYEYSFNQEKIKVLKN